MVRRAFRVLGATAPALASRWAETLFLTPGRYRPRPRERYALSTATAIELPFRFGAIRAWSWGAGPVVLLVHGWGGAGAQLARFAPSLVSAGYQVVTFDGPAHGASRGRRASLPMLAECVRHVSWHVGAPHAVLAHSMGAAAVALALRGGLVARRAVFLGPPAEMLAATHRFASALAVSEPVRARMAAQIEARFGLRLAELSLPTLAAQIGRATELLVVHDLADRDVPWSDGARIAAAWPGARLMTTEGLGHRGVLRDARVVGAVADFVAGRSESAGWLARARSWPDA